MPFVIPVETPIIEVSIQDPQAVLTRFASIMSHSLPGFLVDHANNDATETHVAALKALISEQFHLLNSFGIGFDTRELPDQGVHLDLNSVRCRSVNFYEVEEGEVDVSLLRVRPALVQQIIGNQEGNDRIWTRIDQAGKLVVNDELVIPEIHTTKELRHGKTLIFSDNSNVHDFRSTVEPRTAHATVFRSVSPVRI